MLREDDYTVLGEERGRTLYRLAAEVERLGVPGDLVDCGVFNGGSTALMSAGAPSRRAWAFDSFEGLPPPGPKDPDVPANAAGGCHGSPERVREAFERYASPERLEIVAGWFDETFPRAAPGIETVAVLNVDCDWYDPVTLTLDTFYPRIAAGGFVVIDDYGHWEGSRRATDEFRDRQGIDEPLEQIDYTGVFWQKR
jgi:hypothetical protein